MPAQCLVGLRVVRHRGEVESLIVPDGDALQLIGIRKWHNVPLEASCREMPRVVEMQIGREPTSSAGLLAMQAGCSETAPKPFATGACQCCSYNGGVNEVSQTL